MCWISHTLNKKIAEKDIICYKCVIPVYETKKFLRIFPYKKLSHVISLFYKYKYKILEKNPHIFITNIEYSPSTKTYKIHAGYHSYSKVVYDPVCLTFKCIIPKGTVYYESDSYNIYVSENIIITNKEV